MSLSKRRWVIIVVGAVAALAVLAGAGTWWWRWDTGRQPQVRDVVTAMNRSVSDVVQAAGPGAAAAVSPVVRTADCRLGFLRQGGMFTAKADLYTNPGDENGLLTTIASRLPAGYAVSRGPAVAGAQSLQITDGSAVMVAVERLSPGWLEVIARSRCSLGAVAAPPAVDTGPGVTALTGILGQLGTRPATMTEQEVTCAAGAIVTVAAVSEPVDTGGLAARLAAVVPAGAIRFESGESNRVVYRDGDSAVVIASSDDGTAVTAQYTTFC